MRSNLLKLIGLAAVAGIAVASCNKNGSPTQPTPACAIAISPATLTFGSDGGTGSVTVTAPAGCPWSAAASGGWISVTAGASGSGPGTVTYAVTANAATDARNGSLTIGGESHAVVQQGRAPASCSYDVSPGIADFGKDAGAGSFTVSAPGGCSWTASSAVSWIAIVSGAQAGSGTVSYTVARNDEVADRTGVITVADRRFTVRQTGDAGRCQYSVAPVQVTPCMPGGSVTATITTQAFCPWTATPNAPWLAVASGASGTGSGAITMTFGDNYDAPREGVVMVRWPTPTEGQNIHIAQAGCRYAVSRAAFSLAAAGGSATFDVIQQSDPNTCGGATQDRCVWTARSDVSWITVTSSMPRSGDNPVAFTVAANESPASRVGSITVRDQVVVITQAGR